MLLVHVNHMERYEKHHTCENTWKDDKEITKNRPRKRQQRKCEKGKATAYVQLGHMNLSCWSARKNS